MQTSDYREAYARVPGPDKPAILALSVLIERIGSLPKTDRDELFELLQFWRKADDPEEQQSIHRAMEEILCQTPITSRPLPLANQEPMTRGLKAWTLHVGRKIREAREKAGLTQVELARKAGLPQSHISRLENAEHSATNLTLSKIATALGMDVGQFDPCVD